MKAASDDALLAAWEETLGSRDEAAIFATDESVLRTFGDIEAEAQRFCRDLLRDCEPGQVVAIQIGNHESWPALLLACLRSGLIVLPLERTISERERDAAFATCGVAAAAVVNADQVEILRTKRPAAASSWSDKPPVVLKLTSGTTATPRAVRFRSEQLIADCEQICETMEITRRDLNFAAIPVSHSYGFSNLITPLIVRGVPMVISRDRMPRALLDALVLTEATVFPGMPVFYQALCELEDVPPLPALRVCISAGAPLPLELAKAFRSKFGHAIHSFYGSSECGGICYDRVAALVEEGYVGEPMSRVELEITDETGGPTQVRVRSNAVGDGYFPDADPDKLGDGAFLPDDLLVRSGDGFTIVGRVSDLINVAGKKVNPAEIEAELLRCSGVRAAVAFGRESASRNQEVAACVVADSGAAEAALLDHCRRTLSAWQVPKRIFFVDAIPVNERGKLSRRALAEQFRS